MAAAMRQVRPMTMPMVVMPVTWMAMVGDRAVSMAHPAIRQMRVIVVMLVDGQCRRGLAAEQPAVFRA